MYYLCRDVGTCAEEDTASVQVPSARGQVEGRVTAVVALVQTNLARLHCIHQPLQHRVLKKDQSVQKCLRSCLGH
jgi:hypothetical protein